MHDVKKISRGIMIPSFGNWDSCDEFQITRYFESARQAGLLRGQSFRKPDNNAGVDVDLFKLDVVPPPLQYYYCRKPRKVVVERKHQQQEQHQQQRRRHDHQNRHHHRQPVQQKYQTNNQYNNKASARPAGNRDSGAVDEDLYKIPPELLYQKPKRKAVLAHLWKKCMSLDCVP